MEGRAAAAAATATGRVELVARVRVAATWEAGGAAAEAEPRAEPSADRARASHIPGSSRGPQPQSRQKGATHSQSTPSKAATATTTTAAAETSQAVDRVVREARNVTSAIPFCSALPFCPGAHMLWCGLAAEPKTKITDAETGSRTQAAGAGALVTRRLIRTGHLRLTSVVTLSERALVRAPQAGEA